MQKTVRRLIKVLEGYANRIWYAPVLGVLAAVDSFVIVVPTDGLLVSGAMLAPRRWPWLTFFTGLGSALGSGLLAYLVATKGLPWLLALQPGIEHTRAWIYTDQLMDSYGTWAVFGFAVTPIMNQPAVALAALAGRPLTEIFLVTLLGRLVKYGLLAYVGTHAPGLLAKAWGFKEDLAEAGVETKADGRVLLHAPPPAPEKPPV